MTREEAIETLKANYPDKCFESLRNAVDIAIESLEADVPDTNVGDLISRKAAISAAENESQKYGAYGYMDTKSIIDMLEDLPSAQPEPCEDAVSRRRLLGDLKELISAWKKYPVMAEQIKGVETAIGYLERIPPVTPQPERQKGKWIDETFKPWGLVHHPYKCNQCGEHSEADSNFCPNCGAEMTN